MKKISFILLLIFTFIVNTNCEDKCIKIKRRGASCSKKTVLNYNFDKYNL